MKIEEIKTVVEMMSAHDLTEFKVEDGEVRLCIKRGGETIIAAPAMVAPQMAMPVAAAVAPVATDVPAEAQSAEEIGESIDSPIVGTFYSSPSPDVDAFVSVGSAVTPDTVVCIVEAMKVMNEIKAEKSGVIKKMLIDNAQAVEFGQPLFILE